MKYQIVTQKDTVFDLVYDGSFFLRTPKSKQLFRVVGFFIPSVVEDMFELHKCMHENEHKETTTHLRRITELAQKELSGHSTLHVDAPHIFASYLKGRQVVYSTGSPHLQNISLTQLGCVDAIKKVILSDGKKKYEF